MIFLIAALLGLVQGLTEFLPVSSSGHLALIQNLIGADKYFANPVAFDVVLHLGTLASVVIAFKKDVVELIRGFFGLIFDRFRINGRRERKLFIMVLIGSIPLIIGALIEKLIDTAFSNTLFIGMALCVTAVMLYMADMLGGGTKKLESMDKKDAVTVGLCQLVAVFPGISRSGATMSGGLLCGFERTFAVSFAFLLSIPAIFGAAVVKIPDLFAAGFDWQVALSCLIGFAVALFSGLAAIGLVKMLVKKGHFRYFAIYCAAVGVITIIVSLIRR